MQLWLMEVNNDPEMDPVLGRHGAMLFAPLYRFFETMTDTLVPLAIEPLAGVRDGPASAACSVERARRLDWHRVCCHEQTATASGHE
jgi:hypothetical protein